MSNNTKINYITNLRVFACISVILCHVAANNWYGNIESKRWIVLTIYTAFSRFCVPAFLMISGALFLRKDKEITIKKIYKHNILKMVVILVFWGICYQIYNLTVVQHEPFTTAFARAIFNTFKGETQVHLWYIYTVIGLYMIVPVIKPWIDNLNKKQIEYFLLLFLIFNCMYSVFCNFNIGFLVVLCNFISKLSINIVGGYIGYFVLGYYLSTYDIPKNIRIACYAIGCAAVISCIAATVIYSRYIGAPTEIFWNYNSFLIFLWSTCIFVFFKYNLDWFNKYTNRIEGCTLGIYVFHMFIVFELWRLGFSTFSFSSIFSVPVIVLIVLIVSWGFVAIIRKIPVIKNWIV